MPLVKILIGVPGSGKSSYTKKYKHAAVCSADNYFAKDGEYFFDPKKLGPAHQSCKESFINALNQQADLIIIDNTNTKKREFNFYVSQAEARGYDYEFILFDCDINVAAKRNIHNVSAQNIERMQRNIDNTITLLPPDKIIKIGANDES